MYSVNSIKLIQINEGLYNSKQSLTVWQIDLLKAVRRKKKTTKHPSWSFLIKPFFTSSKEQYLFEHCTTQGTKLLCYDILQMTQIIVKVSSYIIGTSENVNTNRIPQSLKAQKRIKKDNRFSGDVLIINDILKTVLYRSTFRQTKYFKRL